MKVKVEISLKSILFVRIIFPKFGHLLLDLCLVNINWKVKEQMLWGSRGSWGSEEIHGHTYPTPNLILDQIDQQVPIPICPPTFVPFCLSIQNAIMQKHY